MKKFCSLFLCFILSLGLCACTSKEATKHTQSIAVVYFSVTNNTKKVAQKIQKELDCDIYEMKPQEAYTSDDINYNKESCRANQEQQDDASRPKIKNDLKKLEKYDTIYLGYPIWWSTHPRIIQTLLDTYDLSHAKIYLFCTSASSDISTSMKDLKQEYPKLNIVKGKRFNVNDNVSNWLKEGK